ncbi:hypothetical protein GCM10028778_21560 [Barrientosiimonas marina]
MKTFSGIILRWVLPKWTISATGLKLAVMLYVTSCLALAFGLIADNILNLWLDLYGYFGKGVNLKGLAALTTIYL